MRISRPVRSHFSPLPQAEEDGPSSFQGGKHSSISSSGSQGSASKDKEKGSGEGAIRKREHESGRSSLSVSETSAGGNGGGNRRSSEKANETRKMKPSLGDEPHERKQGESLSSKDNVDQGSRHRTHDRGGIEDSKKFKDTPYLFCTSSSPPGGPDGAGGIDQANDPNSFLSILNSSSFKMKRKSFGSESEKRRGERFQREREMSYGAMGISLDKHYEDDGDDDDDDDDCDDDEDESDDDGDDDDESSSEGGVHVCDFSCPLIIHGQCPNATKKPEGSRRRLRARRRSSFTSTSQLTTLLDTGAVGGNNQSVLGSSAARRLHPLISISIDDLTGALGGAGGGGSQDPNQPHQWARNRTLRRRALGAVTRRSALVPTPGPLMVLGEKGGNHHQQQQQHSTSRHHKHHRQHGAEQQSPRQKAQHRGHHEKHGSAAAEKGSLSSAASVSNSAAASGSAAVGETRKLNDHSAPKTPGSSSASLGHSKVHAGKAEADESHHASTSEQPRAEDGGEGTGGGNGSVKVAGEGGPVPAETAQDPSQSQAEQEEKSRSSDSQSMTPSEDSDGDAKSEPRSARSHRLGSFLSIGSKSTDPFSDEVHDQFVGVGHCRFKAPRCFKHLRFPSTLEPHSKIYVSWLFLVTLAFMYNAVVIPLRGVFPYQTPENLRYWLAADYVCDFVYLLDIVVFKSRLRFINNGIDECARTETRKRYMEKWSFKLDIISLAPLDLFYFIKSVGVNPWLRLPRILKIQSYWEFYERCDEASRSAAHAIRIIKTMTYMLFLIHIETCGYYAVSSYEGIASNHWVYQGHGIAYIRCFYLATKTATSIGNNPKPTNELEYIFMTLYWLSGVFVFALLIGQIRDIVEAAGNVKDNYRKKMDSCHWYMQSINLPQELKDRVRQWFLYNWDQQKTIDERSLVSSLPKKLQADLAINVHFNTLSKVRLFQDCERNLLYDLVLKLKPILFLPGDYICRKGEVGKEMYIVTQGEVEVLGGEYNLTVLATLREGSVFGEISLLAMSGGGNRRTADVRCKGYTNVFTLSKHDFQLAMMEYPEAQAVLKKRAKKLLKLNARLERRYKKSKTVETTTVKQYQEKEELVQETSVVSNTLIQVTDPDQNVVQQLSTSHSNNFLDIQPRIMTRSHSQRLNSPGPSLMSRLTPSRSHSYREGLTLSALTFGKDLSGSIARGYSSASLKARSSSYKDLYDSDEDSSGPMGDDPFDELSLSEMLHGSSASSSFDDDNEESEGDKDSNAGSISDEKVPRSTEKQALIRPPSFKVNLKSFCKGTPVEEHPERALSKLSPGPLKSPMADTYRPSCLATGKGDSRSPICGQSIVDGGTRADFFHVNAMGASFLDGFYLDNVRPSSRGANQKTVSFSDVSCSGNIKSNYSDSYNNNNCNSNCQSSLKPKNKVYPAYDKVACSDTVSPSKEGSPLLAGMKDQEASTPPVDPDACPVLLSGDKSNPRGATDLHPKDFNDVFEVFHDSQSDLTCCPSSGFQTSSPLHPSAFVEKSSNYKSKEKSKCNEIDEYMREEKAAEARYLSSILPPEALFLSPYNKSETGAALEKGMAKNKVVRNRLPAVSFDENSPNNPSTSGSKGVLSVGHGCVEKDKNCGPTEGNDPEMKEVSTSDSTDSHHMHDTSGLVSGATKTTIAADKCGTRSLTAGSDSEGPGQPPISRLLEMLTPCTSTALLATGLEVAGCGGYGVITRAPLPPSPTPKVSLSSSSTSLASSSSSPSRPCTSFFPYTPTCSNGSPPSLTMSATSRTNSGNTFPSRKVSNLCFSFPSPLTSTTSSTQKNQTGNPVMGTDKVSQITVPVGNETPCERPPKLTSFESVSANKSTSPKPASKVSPLLCNAPTDSSTDGSFSKSSFQVPLSNGLTNCRDRPPQLLKPASINKRVVFVPDMYKHKGPTSAPDIQCPAQTSPPQSATKDVSHNHMSAVDVTMRSRKIMNSAMSQMSSVKTSNKHDTDMYRQKETSL